MSTVSKEEYLKRYLSPQDNNEKPKKKRKKKSELSVKNVKGFKIVDDDVGWDTFTPKPDEFDEVNDKLLTLDEKPIIENIDARTEEEKKLDEYRRSKMWKTLDADDAKAKEENRRHGTRTKKAKRRKRSTSDSDMDELPRRNIQDSDSDLDNLPRSKMRRQDSDSDVDTLPRRRPGQTKRTKDSDSDLDIPRNKTVKKSSKYKRNNSDSDLEVQRTPSNKSASNKTNMQGGGKGGLTSVDLLRMEMKKLEKKESSMKTMAEEYKNAETVYRERGSGKKRDLAKEKEATEEEVRRKKKKEDQYKKWGLGIKQAEMRANAIADTIHESNKSLTRYNDDEDLEAMRKEAIREGDPMAAYIAKKKRKEQGLSDDRPKYRGPPPPPNRFAISPGYRWDGVDRSNGFEKRYFQSLSDNQANKEEIYKWSVGDM